MKEKELSQELQNWFDEKFNQGKPNNKNVWSTSLVAKTIKSNLEKSKNWKKRGLDKRNAKFGWEVKEYNRKVKEEGYKGPKPVNF